MTAAELALVVPGPPVPKQRARQGKGGHWYTPEPTRSYELAVHAYGTAARLRARWPSSDASNRFVVTIDVFLPDERGRDVDNIAKSVLDALNRNVWRDDRQVARLVVNRHVDRSVPRTEVRIARVQGERSEAAPTFAVRIR
jgi:Holliday junction resolvase RusA-like endonuclease